MRGIYKPRADRYDHRLLNSGKYRYRIWDPNGLEHQVITIVPGKDAGEDVLEVLAAMDNEERLEDRRQDEITVFTLGKNALKNLSDESTAPETVLFGEEPVNTPEMTRLVEAIGKLTPAQIDLFRDLFALQEPLAHVARRDCVSRQAVLRRRSRLLERLTRLMSEYPSGG